MTDPSYDAQREVVVAQLRAALALRGDKAMLSAEQLGELGQLEAAATQGPWERAWNQTCVVHYPSDDRYGRYIYVFGYDPHGSPGKKYERDRAFIMAARNHFKDLLATARRAVELEAEVERLQERIAELETAMSAAISDPARASQEIMARQRERTVELEAALEAQRHEIERLRASLADAVQYVPLDPETIQRCIYNDPPTPTTWSANDQPHDRHHAALERRVRVLGQGGIMSNVEEYALRTKRAAEGVQEAMRAVRQVDPWSIGQVVGSLMALMERFAPFKIDDRVRLTRSFTTDKPNHGWRHCQHFLVGGAIGTVQERGYDYKSNQFTFSVMFDGETWIDQEGVERPVSSRHVFGFNEDWLEAVPKSGIEVAER